MISRRDFLKGLLATAVLASPVAKLLTQDQSAIAAQLPVSDKLMGFKGKSFYEAGYIYAPYIPITIVRLHPNTISSDLVTVSPMAEPSNKIFYQEINLKGWAGVKLKADRWFRRHILPCKSKTDCTRNEPLILYKDIELLSTKK